MRYILIVILSSFLSFCSETKPIGDIKIMDPTVTKDLQTLSTAKIFFGHQSVGYNIMDGVNDLIKEAGNDSLQVIEMKKGTELPPYYFAHARVGKNTEPDTKCDAFAQDIHELFKNNLDMAALKFCFVDMRADDDPQQVFDYYKSTMDSLKKQYPHTRFIHFTLPLTTIQTGWKVPLKKLLGKEISGFADNMKRAAYNRLLKKYYKDDPIFDLSAVESTYPDGRRQSFEVAGKTYYALIPQYSSDRGHLNTLGRRIVAKAFVHVLAQTFRSE